MTQLEQKLALLDRKICSAKEVFTSPTALTGTAKSCYKFGIDTSTGNLYYRDVNNQWQLIPTGGGSSSAWNLIGNAGTNPTTNFIGTTDNQPLKFKTNNNVVGTFGTDYSIAMGYLSNASNTYATAIGFLASSAGFGSTSFGYAPNAAGAYSVATGFVASASGTASFASGYTPEASGNSSTSMGEMTKAKSFGETSLGLYNTNYTPLSATIWNATDRLFGIGNGTTDSLRSDALILLKNGDFKVSGTINSGGYTVATLPTAGIVGRTAYVTDALSPTYLGTLTGGGSVKCPVFDNGTAWVS